MSDNQDVPEQFEQQVQIQENIQVFGRKMDIYDRFRNYVRHEDSLINNRMTWLLSIHGFLYATYGFCIQKRLEVVEKIENFSASTDIAQGNCATSNCAKALSHYLSGAENALIQFDYFIYFIIFMGILISAVARSSIVSAEQSILNIQRIFRDHFNVKQVPATKDHDQFQATGDLKTGDPLGLVYIVDPNGREFVLPDITRGGLQKGTEGIATKYHWATSTGRLIPVLLMAGQLLALSFTYFQSLAASVLCLILAVILYSWYSSLLFSEGKASRPK